MAFYHAQKDQKFADSFGLTIQNSRLKMMMNKKNSLLVEALDHRQDGGKLAVVKRILWITSIVVLLNGCTSEDDLNRDEIDTDMPSVHQNEQNHILEDTSFMNQGLIAYYPFNGNASDTSGNDHNTTVHGTILSADRHGSSNKAYSFDGTDDYMLVKDSTTLRPKYITISNWVYPAAYGIMMILGKTTYANAQGEQYGLSLTELTPAFSIKRNSGGALGVGWQQVNSSSAIPINQWSHLAATWNGIALKIYVDGQLKKQNTEVPVGPIDNLTGGNLQMGRWLKSDSFHYAGKIDEIRIYDRALSSAEVATLYHFEKQGN